MLVLAALVLAPLAQLQLRVLGDLGSARRAVELPRFRQTLLNTFGLAGGSTVFAVCVGTSLAVCAMRLPARARAVLGLVPVLPLVVPSVASVTGWVFLLSPRAGFVNQALRNLGIGSGASGPIDIFSLPGIVILTGVYLTSFVYLFTYASLRQRGAELELAAAAHGAGPWNAFRTITLPLLRPAMTYSAGTCFLLGLGQFTVPLFLGAPRRIDVLTTEMFRLSQGYPIDYGIGAALALPLVVAGVLVVVGQRLTLGDERKYAGVTGKSRQVPIRTSWLAAIPLVGYSFVVVVLPLAALVVTSVSPFWSGKISPGDFTLDAYRRGLTDSRLAAAVGTSVQTTAAAIAVVVPLGFVCALVLANRVRSPRVVRVTVDVLCSLALSMPAALFGFALLSLYAGPPFRLYGTTTVIVIAYVTLMVPHALRPQLTAVLATGREYGEASRVSGAGPIRTVAHVLAPLARSGVGVSVALVVVLLFHEFAASVMVRSASTQVMGTLLYDQWTAGTYPDVAVVAMVTVVVTTAGVIGAVLVGGLQALESV